MASPFPRAASSETAHTRVIRTGIELIDFTAQRPDGKILPQKGEENILITSALPYVNNQPHLGNIIGSTLSADVFARYSRGRNKRTLYICGTDEYGTTTEVMAAKENVGPQELCDKYHKLHAEAYEWFEIGFDHFGRTTTQKQTEICQDIFLKLHANGWLQEQNKEQLFCEKDQRFLADRYVEGICPVCKYPGARGDQCENCSQTYDPLDLISPLCSTCNSAPISRFSSHFFLRLAALQPEIESWVEKASSGGVWSNNGLSFTKGWLRGGLQSRCMTRDLVWGVQVPEVLGEKWAKKVMYVWFDAPIGYPSITANYTDDWKEWWQNPSEVKLHQFMGKDNVPFHTILFPAYLMGTNDPWTMLHSISTTEYLQYEGAKFSKSKNLGVFGQNAKETGVAASVWRYYLLSNRPESSDSEFTWEDFVAKNNTELLNNLGNFVNRMIKFVNVKYDSTIPNSTTPTTLPYDSTLPHPSSPLDSSFITDINAHLLAYNDQMSHQKIRASLATIMQISSRGNQFIQENHLDNALLLKEPERCAEVVILTLNLIYLLSALVQPFMPSTADSIVEQLNAVPRSIPEKFQVDLLPGHRVGEAKHLFSKIDTTMVGVWRAQFGGTTTATTTTTEETKEAPSKKAALKAKKAAAKAFLASKSALASTTLPATPEQLLLEEKIVEQGLKVKGLKIAAASASSEIGAEGKEEIEREVKVLLEMKAELAGLKKGLEELKIVD